LLAFLDPWRWDREVFPKRRQGINTIRCNIAEERRYQLILF
jgi:hypothetical protein